MSTTEQLVQAIAKPTGVVAIPRLKTASGTIAVSDPRIQLIGHGTMPFPLRVRHLRQIESIATQSPYGKGTETIVDTTVRNTREISPEAITVADEFQQAVRAILPDVAASLGLPADELIAELYKLLIYEKGGRFDWHRDAEKRKGMVGSLIVVLPCKFSGGALTIRNQHSRDRHDFRVARDEQAAQYVAFYADSEHSVERVISGVRVCLAYNLILKPKKKTVPVSSDAGSQVTDAISQWMTANPDEPMVVALEHQYTADGLKPGLLKGTDREIGEILREVATELGCHLHYGMVSRHLCQYADDGNFGYERYSRYGRQCSGPINYDDLNIGEVYEDEIIIDGWKDAEGNSVRIGDLGCDDSSLISLIPIEKWKPERQDYEGYTGNAGNTLDRWYHKSAIVLWSREKHFDILTRSGLESAIDEFVRMRKGLAFIENDDDLAEACDACYRFARAIIGRWPQRLDSTRYTEKYDQTYLKQFADILIRFEDPDLVSEWLEVVANRDWRFPLNAWIPIAIKTLGSDEVVPCLKRLLQTTLPPNQNGAVRAKGLPNRDAKWLLMMCEKHELLNIPIETCSEMLDLAIDRFATDIRDGKRNYEHSIANQQATWSDLVKASLVLAHQQRGESSATRNLFELVNQSSVYFDLRSFQTAGCIELSRWSQKQFGIVAAPVVAWHDSIRQQLLQAIASQPLPPTDQTRSANVSCGCQYCRRLVAFLLDSTQSTETIRARQDCRTHVEESIRQHQLDIASTTIRSGIPHGLVMTKTQATYERTLKRYHADLELIQKLESVHS